MINCCKKISALFLVVLACILPAYGISRAAEPVLTNLDFSIFGVSLNASPGYQAVPKGIATQVNTLFSSGGAALPADVLQQLPKNLHVEADLSGPSFQTPKTLSAPVGSPLLLPSLPLIGKYTLGNIRLVDNLGQVLFSAIPQMVTIESISDPLVTSVTTRQLTIAEMKDRGVVIDSSNFTAFEFTAAIATESGRVPLNFPVLIPARQTDIKEPVAAPDELALTPPKLDNFLEDNISIEGFQMELEIPEAGDQKIVLPPIPGIVIIPGNIGFLHQFFSALVVVSNGAPGMSDLVVKNLQARIITPNGEDLVAGTDAAPGDDPIRMAKGADGYFQRMVSVMNAGPDDKSGTVDDVNLLQPAQSGQADFTIEGLKEGGHELNFEITATLEGLPIGPVSIKGKARGAVLVRNPDFSITLGHPATIRSGEAYDMFVNVTNTSKAAANLVSVHLDPRAISGAVLAPDETGDKQIETILPGSSGLIKFRLISQRTGRVTATAFASEDIKGRFILRVGVGEAGIPLSPDSLIVPYTGDLPSGIVNAAVGLLGQAWSVATAPPGALPADVLPVSKQFVTLRANDLSEAGLRITLGENAVKAVEDLYFDFLGSDNSGVGFDSLRRRSTPGQLFNDAVAQVFQSDVAASGAFGFQAGLAAEATYRPAHISVITSDSPVRVRVTDAQGQAVGALNATDNLRQIPYADQIVMFDAVSHRSTLTLLSKIESTEYLAEFIAGSDAATDIGVVVPGSTGTLRQIRFASVVMPAGAKARLKIAPWSDAAYALEIDSDNDGVVDQTLPQSSTLDIYDVGPQVVSVVQLTPGIGAGGDKHGRNVAVLFSEKVAKQSAENVLNYAVDANEVKMAYLQPGGRMAFLLLRDGIGPFFQRNITVNGIADLKGNSIAPPGQTIPITITAKGPAAVVYGTIRKASGEPIPGATIRLQQQKFVDTGLFFEYRYFIYSEKSADANGEYRFDYVFQNDDPPRGPFKIEAVDPATGETGVVSSGVAYHGQTLGLDVFMKAKGSVFGIVRDSSGSAVPNASVMLSTLNDSRSYLTSADGSGAFSFAQVNAGPFSLKAVSHALYSEGTIMGVISDNGGAVTQDVVIYSVSLPKGNVAGKVLNPDGITPRPGVLVTVEVPNYRNWARTDANGMFSFIGVYGGTARVTARDETTGESTYVNGTVADGATSVFNVILNGTGSVSGHVVREDGISAAGMYVLATMGPPAALFQMSTLTDASGRFTFDNVPTGSVDVRLPDPKNFNLPLAQGSVTVQSAGSVADIILFVPATPSYATITGTVYRKDGSIFPNVTVMRIDRSRSKYWQYAADAQGVYTIPFLSPGNYTLVVRNGVEISNATVALQYGGQIKTVDMFPVGMGSVTGTVYDSGSGMMPVGADVRLISLKPDVMGWLGFDTENPTTVKSDPQSGRFNITGVYNGSYSISATNILRPVPAVKSGALTYDNEVATVDLVLKDTFGGIDGDVKTPNGTPAGSGIRVTVRYGGADVTVTTDVDGKFHFAPAIPAGSYAVTAEDPVTTLKAQAWVSVPAGGVVPVSMRLLGRGEIDVLVLNPDGTPEPLAVVSVSGSGFPQDSATGTADQYGRAVFYNLSEGAYAVSAVGSFNRGGRAQAVISSDGAVASVNVVVAASGSVTGKFLKPDGVTPITGGQIKLLNTSRSVLAYGYSSSDPSAAGEFRFDHVPIGDFILEAYDPMTDRMGIGGGRLTTNLQVVSANVIVTPRGTVKGTVLNYSGAAPIDKATVSITVTGVSGWNYGTVTAPDGSFVFTGVPAGLFNISVIDKATGLVGSSTGRINYEAETASAEIRLQASGSIEGVVYRTDGVTPEINAGVCLDRSACASPLSVDTQGRYAFYNLVVGSVHSVYAYEAGTHRAVKGAFGVTYDGEVVNGDLKLNGIGTVLGTVFDSDGVTPLSGAIVTLTASNGVTSAAYTAYTDASGLYDFSDVPSGAFTVRASHTLRTTGSSASGVITAEGQSVTVDMTLGSVGGISGKVLLADGVTPATGGLVTFTGCSRTLVAVIDSTGMFLFDRIPLCQSFSLKMVDSRGVGIGYFNGALSQNGQAVDAGSTVLDDKAITVIDVTPADGTANVSGGSSVTVVFSEPADPATLTSSNIYLTKGGVRVNCALSITSDNTSVTLTPSSPLAGFALHSVNVTTGVKDMVGRALLAAFTSGFTTVDNVPPTVSGVTPTNGANQIASDSVVRVTFSESVDPASMSGVKLRQGGSDVPIRLDMAQGNTVAILTPLSPLVTDIVYSVSVAGAADTVGNVMQGSYFSSFATIDTIVPVVSSLTVPAGSDVIKGNTVTLMAAVSSVDVALVSFVVDGQLAATDSTSPYTYNLMLSKEGLTSIKVVSQDRVGNIGIPVTLDLNVAPDTAPVVAITSPAEGSSVNAGSPFIVTVTAADDLWTKEITLVSIGEVVSTQTMTNASGKTFTTSFTLNVPTGAAPMGAITITVIAKDSAGNASQTVTRNLTVVDKIAPMVSITSPGQTTRYKPGEAGTAIVTSSDNVGVSSISCTASGAATGSGTFDFVPPQKTASWTFDFSVSADAAPNAAITLACIIKDSSGNQMASGIGLAVADTVAPVIQSLAIPAGSVLVKGATVVVTADVPAADAAFVDFYLDGGLAATDASRPYALSLPLSVEGVVTVSAVAQDAAGNRSAAATLAIDVVADMPPTVSISFPPAGLVALYDMDGQWVDSSGNGLSGAPNGGVGFSMDARTGSHSGAFDGVDDYVSVADSNSLDMTTNISIELWVYLNSLKNNALVVKGAGSYALGVYSTGYVSWGKHSYDELTSATPLSANSWHHIVATRTGGNNYIYINGVLNASGSRQSFNNTSSPLYIGSNLGIAGWFLNGRLDNVGVFNRALTAEEVAYHYSNGAAGIVPSADGVSAIAGLPLRVDATVVDDVAVVDVTLTASGEATFSQTITNASGGRSFTAGFIVPVPSEAVAGGQITLIATGKDSVGNAAQSVRTVTVVDKIAPQGSITSPGQTVRYKPGEAGVATVTASDNGGVSSISCVASGAATGSGTFDFVPRQKTASWTFDFLVNQDAGPAAMPPQNVIMLVCTVTDGSLNQTTANLTLDVADVFAPSLSITSPDEGTSVNAGLPFTVNVTAADDLWAKEITLVSIGEVVSTQTKMNASGKTFTTSFTLNVPTGAAPAGAITLTATAMDSSGNASQTVTRNLIVVDKIVPTVSIASPGQATLYRPGETGAVTVSASDNSKVVNVACAAAGAASGADSVTLNPTQQTASVPFAFTVSPSAGTNAAMTVSCTVTDDSGNQTTKGITMYVADVVPPVVSSSSVADGELNVPLTAVLTVTFNEAVKPSSVTAANVTLLLDASGAVVAGAVSLSADHKAVSFTPSSALTLGAAYRLVFTGILDEFGNVTTLDIMIRFTTIPPDLTPPAVVSVTPANGAQSVKVISDVTVVFDEAVDPGSVTGGTFVVSSTAGAVSCGITFSADNKTVRFRPLSQLAFNTSYTVTLKAGIRDAAGNPIVADYVSAFMTGGFGLAAPRDNSFALMGSPLKLSASSDPGLGVFTVNFYVDGERVGSKGTTPYTMYYPVPGAALMTVHTISVEGVTSAGKMMSEAVVVTALDPAGDEDNDGLTNSVEVVAGTDPLTTDANADPDNDGLSNFEEIALGTDPNNRDTDGDGLSDYEEVRNRLTDPLKADTDGDGLSDGAEVNTHHTDPLKPDTDNDGVPDGWEMTYGYNPLLADTNATGVLDGDRDQDADGLANKYEACLVTNPANVMTDGVTADGLRDDDGDGWKNVDEVNIYRTSPCLADTDGDGVIDPDEKNVLLTDPNNKNDLYGSDLMLNAKTIRVVGKAQFNNIALTGNATLTTLSSTTSRVYRMELDVLGNLTVDAGSKIDVTGRGYAGGYQPGNLSPNGRTLGNTTTGGSYNYAGGSYGGYGGISNTTGSVPNAVYGDYSNPEDVGSGGSSTRYYWGGNGGGLVRIKASGTVTVNGSIVADGGASMYNAGGSGGGIRIDAASIAGTGVITANGGVAGASNNATGAGGGGGGRIALYYDSMTLPSANVNASGGKAWFGDSTSGGGAGTVYLKSSASSNGRLIVHNSFTSSSATLVSGAALSDVEFVNVHGVFDSVVVGGNLTLSSGSTVSVMGPLTVTGALWLTGNSTLTHPSSSTGSVSNLDINAGSINVDVGSMIDLTGRGYVGGYHDDNFGSNGRTLGNTTTGGSYNYAGGSYGGYGGISTTTGSVPNAIYGDYLNPEEVGSGGSGLSRYVWGGNGGGLARIRAAGITVNGSIVADGGGSAYGAGGSGGGIRIEAGSIAGSGVITANGGGNGSIYAGYINGGGGGGRIALYYDTMTLPSANVKAFGGTSGGGVNYYGSAGTIYMKSSASANGSLLVRNNSVASSFGTLLSGVALNVDVEFVNAQGVLDSGVAGGNLTLSGGSMVSVMGQFTVTGALWLTGNSTLTHPSSSTGSVSSLDINAGSITVDAGSKIDVTGGGYAGGYQPGNASPNGRTLGNTTVGGSYNRTGGSYGGYGGISSMASSVPNAIYGDFANPNDVGSGGGSGSDWGGSGSLYWGGNGGGLARIKAAGITVNGSIVADGGGSAYGAGGSGGGIRIEATSIAGTGVITANGGGNSTLSSYINGGGGGGRIALYYDTMTLPSVNVKTFGGTSGGGTPYYGSAGTVYLWSNSLTSGQLIFNANNVVTTGEGSSKLPFVGKGTVLSAAIDSLTATGSPWLSGSLKGLKFKPDTTKAAVFTVIENTANTLFIDPAEGDIVAATPIGGAYVGSRTLDNMTITVKDGAKLMTVDEHSFNGELVVDGGTVTIGNAAVINAGALTVKNGGVLTHAYANATDTYRLDFNVAGGVSIDSTSKIDVSGRGYLGGYQSGNSSPNGRTLGNTTAGGSYNRAGGSYGGYGGISNMAGSVSNAIYGDFANPEDVGSGGSSGSDWSGASSPYWGGNGGGLVRIKSGGDVTIYGQILASGGGSIYGSGGSGGGIMIEAAGAVSGGGYLYARGGAVSANSTGGGGGGRMAVYYGLQTTAPTFQTPPDLSSPVPPAPPPVPTLTWDASGGTSSGGSAYYGGAGTLYQQAK